MATISTLMDLSNGEPISFTVSGSDMAHLLVGRPDLGVELCFDYDSMRTLLAGGQAAVAEMHLRYAHEQAEDQGRCSASSAP